MFTVNGRSPFRHITVKPDKKGAEKFFNEYGGIFAVKQEGKRGNNPAVVLNTSKDIELLVEKREDGIYVQNTMYCKEW